MSRTATKPKPAAKKAAKKVTPAARRKKGADAEATATSGKPSNAKIKIFQIYYKPEQRAKVDPEFLPFDNASSRSPLLEFEVFNRLQADQAVADAAYWGALSWRFFEKTELSGADLVKQIEDNPGYDVYYANPNPELEGIFQNLWVQGETSHPNFLVLVKSFFEAAGLDGGITGEIMPSAYFSTSNYFVASPRFWKAYLDFVNRALEAADQRLTKTIRDVLYSPAADRFNFHGGVTYVPFILERLFSHFVWKNAADFPAKRLTLPKSESRLNSHLKSLRLMKELALKTRQPALYGCWVNYRNLYVSSALGEQWVRRNRQILKAEVCAL